MSPGQVVWISAGLVALWALWAAYFNTAQFGDNIEQFNWAQSLELGYHKHPPLPSWLLAVTIKLFGPSVYWAYVLATLCLLGTAAFTWLIGRRLVGERVAAAAILLWGLNLCFSQRVQLYNHNTVLVLWIAATIWLAMRATAATRGQALWWSATGLAAALAILSKYQAALPLGGLVLALGLAGHLNRPGQRRGLLLATSVALLACLPHAVWVTQHDFSTLRYAAEAIESPGVLARLDSVASFLANQVRFALPALLAIALCWWWGRDKLLSSPPSDAAAAPDLRVWLFGLIWAGVLALVVMALAGGVNLRNHWGVQVLQFSSLWLAYEWDRRAPIDLRRLLGAALLVHGLSLVWYEFEHLDPAPYQADRRVDTSYPARRLARAAVAHWSSTTACPLHYVAGTVFDAGLVSLYSGGDLKVFDSARATPWIEREDLQRRGALYVLEQNDAVPDGVVDIEEFLLHRGDEYGRPARTVRLGVLPPERPCDLGRGPAS